MSNTYLNPTYAYTPAADQHAAEPKHHPVIVVGAGPVGLCAAIDLTQQQVPVVLLEEDDTVSYGSRAICFAKRTLEILDRLGCGQAVVKKGIVWNLGRVYFKNRQIYKFNLLPESDHRRPAFINLQQYYLEEYLIKRARELGVDIRWKNRVIGIEPAADHTRLTVSTPDGCYALDCAYLIAADGAKSPIRHMLGLESKGQVFRDCFLIVDVVMKADFLTQRWFWFDPPFHRNQSVLLHRQADNVWRIDFQLGWDADPQEEKKPERVIARLKAMLGEDHPFELEWVSVYTFTCQRMEKFRHGRVLFAGDAAHQVSPFGARGANSGIQDADNLVWKLKLVLDGKAPEALLDSYNEERVAAADENILNSTRSADFITPKSAVSRSFRDAVLTLAEHYPFARTLINSGRLSTPSVLGASPLNTADVDAFASPMVPGAPCLDAPVVVADESGWLLEHLGNTFKGLLFWSEDLPTWLGDALKTLAVGEIPVHTLVVSENKLSLPDFLSNLMDVKRLAAQRYDVKPGTFYLVRPDQHVAGRWRAVSVDTIRAALYRAAAHKVVGEDVT